MHSSALSEELWWHWWHCGQMSCGGTALWCGMVALWWLCSVLQDGVLRCVVLCCAKVHQAALQYEPSLDVPGLPNRTL